MAGPDQPIPGDEPSDNPSDSARNSNESKLLVKRPTSPKDRLSGLNKSPKRREEVNENWFIPSDLGSLETPPRANSKPRNLDDEDLPDDTSLDKLREDITENYETWQEFDNTDISELARLGLDHLPADERKRKLHSLMLYNKFQEDHSRNKMREDFRDYKDRKFFGVKLFIAYGLSILFMFFIIIFVLLFIYITFKDGTLNDNGIGVGILNTVQEVLRIIFTSGGTGPL